MGRALPGPDDYEQIPALAERGRARVARFFEMMDREWVGREYVAGDRYTIADIMALVTVNFAARIDLKAPKPASICGAGTKQSMPVLAPTPERWRSLRSACR